MEVLIPRMWKRLDFCESGSTLIKEAGSEKELGRIRLLRNWKR